MAIRPVFLPDQQRLVREESVEFKWYPGFSVEQKRRSIRALHEAVRNSSEVQRILEVSTKSEEPSDSDGEALGQQLSAFRLRKMLPDGNSTCLEAAFQGSKVFADGNQLTELYFNHNGYDVKRIMRPWQETPLSKFRFGTEDWPLDPRSAFYDWLYIRALREHPKFDEIQHGLRQCDAFTDIEFNPKKSFNCQARSCALFVALAERSALDETQTRDGFLKVLAEAGYGERDTESECRQTSML